MVIETKYNVGEEVWVKNCFNEPFQMEVIEVYVDVTKIAEIHNYRLANGTAAILRNENEIFSTKEELLKNL